MKKILSALVAVAFALPVLAQAPAAKPAAPAPAAPAAAAPAAAAPAPHPGCQARRPGRCCSGRPCQEGHQEEGQEGPAGHHDAAPAHQVATG